MSITQEDISGLILDVRGLVQGIEGEWLTKTEKTENTEKAVKTTSVGREAGEEIENGGSCSFEGSPLVSKARRTLSGICPPRASRIAMRSLASRLR